MKRGDGRWGSQWYNASQPHTWSYRLWGYGRAGGFTPAVPVVLQLQLKGGEQSSKSRWSKPSGYGKSIVYLCSFVKPFCACRTFGTTLRNCPLCGTPWFARLRACLQQEGILYVKGKMNWIASRGQATHTAPTALLTSRLDRGPGVQFPICRADQARHGHVGRFGNGTQFLATPPEPSIHQPASLPLSARVYPSVPPSFRLTSNVGLLL
jgi:hypothetical protein